MEDKERWIAVTETEKPPDGEIIAINAKRHSHGYHEYLIGYIFEDKKSDTGYSCENECMILENVTHWRHKPEPPEDVEDIP